MAAKMGASRSKPHRSAYCTDDNILMMIRTNRWRIEKCLSENISNAFIQDLVKKGVLNEDANQINRKSSNRAKAASLLDKIIHKGALHDFLDVVKQKYPTIYKECNFPEMLETDEDDVDETDSCGKLNSFPPRIINCLQNPLCTKKAFNAVLKDFKLEGLDLALLCFGNGLGLMHQIIQEDRPEFLTVLQYSGHWDGLFSMRIGSRHTEHYGKTPLEFSVSIGRAKCSDLLNKYQENERSIYDVMKIVRVGDVGGFEAYRRKDRQCVSFQSEDGCTLLDYACQSGSEEMLIKVIRAEKSFSSIRKDLSNAIGVCVDLGYHKLLRILKEYAGPRLDFDDVKISGKLVIEVAATNGDIETYKELIQLGARITYPVVSLAATDNRLDFLKAILHDSSWSRLVKFKDRRDKTAVHFASEKGFPEVVKLLVENGADMEATDKRGYTIVHSAAAGGSVDVLDVILEEAKKKHKHKMLLGKKDHYIGSERCFLLKGRDGQEKAWHYVEVDRGLIDLFRKRSVAGQIDATDYGPVLESGWGENPSAEVVQRVEDRYDMVRIGRSNGQDMLPIHVAILKKHEEVSLRLIEEMDNVEGQDCFGLSPLHLAAMRGMPRVIEALLGKGASLLQEDLKGRTALDLAEVNEQQEAVNILMVPERSNNQLHNMRFKLRTLCNSLADGKIANLKEQIGLEDTKKYIRDLLREANADISDYLFDIGCGPVASETENAEEGQTSSLFS